MLEITAFGWTNFMSFGDYDTEVDLSRIAGPCLITGQVEDGQGEIRRGRSNGAGKSIIPNVPLWCLFGRTMHTENPGDRVINWFTKGICKAWVRLKNGDVIRRTRVHGHQGSELFLERNGDNIIDTRATTTRQQAVLTATYGLSWTEFCGSAFFTQVCRPWLSLTEPQRKKALERILRLDRLSLYAEVAKEKNQKLEVGQNSKKAQMQHLAATKQTVIAQMASTQQAKEQFSQNQQTRATKIQADGLAHRQARDRIALPDLAKLKEIWSTVEKIKAQRLKLEANWRDVSLQVARAKQELQVIEGRIRLWESKSGKVCLECEQPIAAEHIASRKEPLLNQEILCKEEINQLEAAQSKFAASISEVDKMLTAHMPKTTIQEAEATIRQRDHLERLATECETTANSILQESNPHELALQQLEQQVLDLDRQVAELQSVIAKQDVVLKHLMYIQRAYADRKKIKSFLINKRLPYFNRQLSHYLDRFDVDLHFELTDNLSIKSDYWEHSMCSGGEQGRINVAFMLAMFDLHEMIYGRQCNLLVLDEVMEHLDEEGVEMLLDIITNDLPHRVDTIFVISHRPQARDVFPHQILVRKNNASRLSSIVEVR